MTDDASRVPVRLYYVRGSTVRLYPTRAKRNAPLTAPVSLSVFADLGLAGAGPARTTARDPDLPTQHAAVKATFADVPPGQERSSE